MELKQIGPGFAAEVRGIGLAEVATSAAAYAAVRAAFEEHSVLLFRWQTITDELQIAFSQRFGPLEIAKAASRGEGTPFSILTNADRTPVGVLVESVKTQPMRSFTSRTTSPHFLNSCLSVSPKAFGSVETTSVPVRLNAV